MGLGLVAACVQGKGSWAKQGGDWGLSVLWETETLCLVWELVALEEREIAGNLGWGG